MKPHVYLLTIVDDADFQKMEHQSCFEQESTARLFAEWLIEKLVQRDKHHGLGNTFRFEIVKIPLTIGDVG